MAIDTQERVNNSNCISEPSVKNRDSNYRRALYFVETTSSSGVINMAFCHFLLFLTFIFSLKPDATKSFSARSKVEFYESTVTSVCGLQIPSPQPLSTLNLICFSFICKIKSSGIERTERFRMERCEVIKLQLYTTQ